MRTAALFSVVVLSLTVPVCATTYVVPDDAYMIDAAEAIVTGTVGSSHVRRDVEGRIETATGIEVDEWIKGHGARTVVVVYPGGRIGDRALTVSGVPAFAPGERVLLFLQRNRRDDWTTWAFALGAFRLDASGLATRGGGEISGWSADGSRHVERPRLQREFLEYVRAVSRGQPAPAVYFAPRPAPAVRRIEPNATFDGASYSWQGVSGRLRRNVLNVEWRLSGNPGDLDLIEAVDTGIAEWNKVSSRISYTRSPVAASDDRAREDSEARVIANDPHDDVPGQCCTGILAYTIWTYRGTHEFNGQSFATIRDTDIVLNENMSSGTFSQQSLNEVVAHELGHTLGLRHSNKNPADDGPCGEGFDCCVHDDDGGNCVAVMNAGLLYDGPDLEAWDRDAVGCLYEGDCTTTCVAPSFLSQPRGRVLYLGGQTLLSTKVRATPPLAVQWYAGAAGDTSAPLGTSVWQLSIRPQTTTDYWARVTGACGQIDSDPATVTVVRCPGVVLTSASATIVAPGQVRLRAVAAGGGSLRYLWFRRNAPGGPEALIGNTRLLTAPYTEGTTFFVRVENRICGSSAVSVPLTPSETPPPVRGRRSRH